MIDLERSYETLLLDSPAAGVLVVTLNRPDRLNAMTVVMFGELEAVARAVGDDRDIRVVILTGAGKAFCAGYDLDEAEELASCQPWACWTGRNVRPARSAPCGRSRYR
jgi:enoyl-CoA hydratase/carnithine racemase